MTAPSARRDMTAPSDRRDMTAPSDRRDMTAPSPAHLYVHVPFCPSICPFCDFHVLERRSGLVEAYLAAMDREVARLAERFEPGPLQTVYFGGGTPSYLREGELERLVGILRDRLGWAGTEATLEVHPATVTAARVSQWMTKMHNDKYEAFGGNHAAFDPVTNLRVGVQVLKECIARAGSLEAGLRFYVGAANLLDDGGYAIKVLTEQNSLRLVAGGKNVPMRATVTAAAPAAPAAATHAPRHEGTPAAPAPAEPAVVDPEKIALLLPDPLTR